MELKFPVASKSLLCNRFVAKALPSEEEISQRKNPCFCIPWIHPWEGNKSFTKVLQIQKDSFHHFKPDWINNMDHMRISATESSSVVLSKTK